jgi:hypothetical protein
MQSLGRRTCADLNHQNSREGLPLGGKSRCARNPQYPLRRYRDCPSFTVVVERRAPVGQAGARTQRPSMSQPRNPRTPRQADRHAATSMRRPPDTRSRLTMRLSGRAMTYGARLTWWNQINSVSCEWHFWHHGPLQPMVRLPRGARSEAAAQRRC